MQGIDASACVEIRIPEHGDGGGAGARPSFILGHYDYDGGGAGARPSFILDSGH